MTDGIGNLIETFLTDLFGVPTSTHGSSTQPFQFTGQQRDARSGLYDLRARMYDPVIGRFLRRAPLFGDARVPLSLNRFAYVQSKPVRMTDPSGLSADVDGPWSEPSSVGIAPGQPEGTPQDVRRSPLLVDHGPEL